MVKKVVPKLRQEMKVKVDIVSSDVIKIYRTWKFQDFAARYIINTNNQKTNGYQSVEAVQRNQTFLTIFLLW